MKKILLIIAGLIITAPSYATTMCTINDSVGVVLDPNIAITNYTYDNTMGTWRAWSSSWTVHGISACLNSNRGKSMGGTVAHLHDTDNNGDDHLVTGSEKYGRYCWCRLTHPVSSLWAFSSDYGSASDCASDCSGYCGYYVRSNVALRAGLFGSVAPDAN